MMPSAADSQVGWVKRLLKIPQLSEELGKLSCSDQSIKVAAIRWEENWWFLDLFKIFMVRVPHFANWTNVRVTFHWTNSLVDAKDIFLTAEGIWESRKGETQNIDIDLKTLTCLSEGMESRGKGKFWVGR